MSSGRKFSQSLKDQHAQSRDIDRQRYDQLAPEGRRRVDQIVGRHRAVCAKYGIEPSFTACFREAIALVKEGKDDLDVLREPHLERQSYSQYQPPADAYK